MLRGKSLVELAQELELRKSQKLDFIAPTDRIELAVAPQNGVVLRTLNGTSQNHLTRSAPYGIRPIAHDQLGTFTGIPAKYYDRMLSEDPELLTRNVNTWLHRDHNSKRLVRVLNGETRAFLSNRYQRIENEEIASVALPILMSDRQLEVVSTEVTERRLYIQATTARVVGDVKKGDPVQAGVIISNSEVGQGSVSVRRVIWRLMCLNGMILPDNTYRANHTGSRIDDNEALWRDDTRQAEDKAILLKVRDMVQSAMSEDSFRANLAKMQATAEHKITGNPVKAIEVLSNKLGVSDAEQGGILRALIEGGDLSQWGVLNAVTAQAHNTADYDRAAEFEAMGSKVLDLPASEWRVMAEAA